MRRHVEHCNITYLPLCCAHRHIAGIFMQIEETCYAMLHECELECHTHKTHQVDVSQADMPTSIVPQHDRNDLQWKDLSSRSKDL